MPTVLQHRTNAQWLEELRKNDDACADELCAYLRRVLARVLRGRAEVCDSDLDDFTQDAVMRVLKGLDTFRGDSRFTTWATAVAVRVALSALRRRRHDLRPVGVLELPGVEPLKENPVDPGRAAERRSLLATLHAAIEEVLTDRQRCAVLGELAGVPSRVLAQRLGTNPNALYKLHHDARKKLKRALNEAGFSDREVRTELAGASNRS